jgi:hypothetical protein
MLKINLETGGITVTSICMAKKQNICNKTQRRKNLLYCTRKGERYENYLCTVEGPNVSNCSGKNIYVIMYIAE